MLLMSPPKKFNKVVVPPHYIDLAANLPVGDSNTAFFDRCLGWRGVCVEVSGRARWRLVPTFARLASILLAPRLHPLLSAVHDEPRTSAMRSPIQTTMRVCKRSARAASCQRASMKLPV